MSLILCVEAWLATKIAGFHVYVQSRHSTDREYSRKEIALKKVFIVIMYCLHNNMESILHAGFSRLGDFTARFVELSYRDYAPNGTRENNTEKSICENHPAEVTIDDVKTTLEAALKLSTEIVEGSILGKLGVDGDEIRGLLRKEYHNEDKCTTDEWCRYDDLIVKSMLSTVELVKRYILSAWEYISNPRVFFRSEVLAPTIMKIHEDIRAAVLDLCVKEEAPFAYPGNKQPPAEALLKVDENLSLIFNKSVICKVSILAYFVSRDPLM